MYFRNLLADDNRLKREWKAAGDLTSERHMESVIPLFHDMEPSELPLFYRNGSIMPTGYQNSFIKTNSRVMEPLVKKISGNCKTFFI